jgi:broad specificity phosphatase PhoE
MTIVASLLVLGCAHSSSDPRAGTLTIYLARHGQTAWNAEHRLQGWTDVPLNETGRAQAKALAERLRGVHLDRVYSSTLARSRETAEIARGAAPLVSLVGLREQRLGKFEGTRVDSSDVANMTEYERRSVVPDDDLDGGESLDQHLARVRAVLDTIRTQSPKGTILIVGHGGTNKLILRVLLGLTLQQTEEFSQANDELYRIDLDPGSKPRVWKLVTEVNLKDL